MRRVILALIALSVVVWLLQLALRIAEATTPTAPCPDALAAYLQQHWECTNLRYVRGDITLVCITGDVVIRDMITSADTKKYTSFIFENLRTLKQGVCDCEKPFGEVCEALE